METVVEARDLAKTSRSDGGDVLALRGVDLTLRSAELVAVIGPSGCGTSTLLNLLGGFDRPSAGQIVLGGERVEGEGEARRALLRRRHVGFVFQFFNLIPGGQQQRVALARALVNRPTVLLADEPTGNLDSASARDVLELLRRVRDDGQSVVLVTHDARVAAAADRVVSMRDGLVVDETQLGEGRGGATVLAGFLAAGARR